MSIIGVPNWPSVLATAHVLKVAMEENLGLEVELQNWHQSRGVRGDGFSGAMHVHPEVWLPNQANLYQTYVEEKGTVKAQPERR